MGSRFFDNSLKETMEQSNRNADTKVYPSNSHKQRVRPVTEATSTAEPEEKKLEKVVSGAVTQRKKPMGRRFKEMFVGQDARGVISYVFGDIVLPASKDLIVDAGQAAIERSIYGEARPRRRSGGGLAGGLVNHMAYNQMSNRTSRDRREDPRDRDYQNGHGPSRRARKIHDFGEIVLATRREASEVLGGLEEQLGRYQFATVADLYDLCDIDRDYTDAKWGWYDLSTARVQSVRGGFVLDLPRPEPIND